MKRPQIRNIIPHFVQCEHSLSDGIAEFHAQIIESRLNRLDLTTEQKLTVIDQIIVNLKSNQIHTVNH